MYQSTLVLGIDAQGLPAERQNLEKYLGLVGTNTGNIIFSEALFSVIKDSRRSSYHFLPQSLQGVDNVVIAAANWLNPYSDFGEIAARLEATKLPVSIVGLGAQSDFSNTIPKLRDGTMRLVKLVAERSASLGVRGQFSAEVLESYGIHNVTVTGCPTLLLCGAKGPAISKMPDFQDTDAALHSTRHLFNPTQGLQKYLYKQAFGRGLDLVLQSELADFYYAMRETGDRAALIKANDCLKKVYDVEDIARIRGFLEVHGKVFLSIQSWIDYLKTKKFCLGTRIHGTVISLIAGTPGLLIAHDSRTLEMAEAMRVPYIKPDALSLTSPLKLGELYSSYDSSALQSNYFKYRNAFADFFNRNRIATNL